MSNYPYTVSLRGAHRLSDHNRASIGKSDRCGCFCCVSVFAPTEVVAWIDRNRKDVGQTALCPRCGIDSVLAAADIDFDTSMLAEMKHYWFGKQYGKL